MAIAVGSGSTLGSKWTIAAGACAFLLATAAAGCTINQPPPATAPAPAPAPATVEVAPAAAGAQPPAQFYESEPVTAVPPNITVYPRVTYYGRPAYLVDGRWYYSSPRGWVVLRREPVELARYRTTLRQSFTIGGYPVVRSSRVPEDLGRYPRLRYGNSYAYLIDGRWYYAAPEGWVMFQREPAPLAQYRVRLTAPVLEIGGYHVDRARTVPPDIRERPHVTYRGSEAYLVDGQWYYPSAQGWVVFREEPRELGRYRTQLGTRPYRTRQNPYGYPPPARPYRP